MQLHCFWGHVEGGALVVVGHMGVARVQELTQPKVCKVAGGGGGRLRLRVRGIGDPGEKLTPLGVFGDPGKYLT